MNRCAAQRARALDYVLGDVVALERTRLEAHIDRCDECRELVERLSAAFTAAKRWPPEPAEQDLEHLIRRLEPYFEPDEPRAPLFGGFARAVLAAAAATAAIVFFASSYTEDQVPISQPLAVHSTQTAPVEIVTPPAPPPAIVRLKPRPHVKLVAGGGWDGKVAGESNDATSIVMSRGFAMIDFEGGQGRKLWVGAPNASIEVVGTRFFVDTAPNGLTTVGVISGKVVVATAEGRAAIAAGEKRTFGEARRTRPATSAAETFAEDPFLAREAHAAATPKKHVAIIHGASAGTREPVFDPTLDLSAAQRLARGSDPRAALAKYEALLTRLGEKDPLAPLVRYERARLLAFSLNEKTRGELELHAVADAGRGEASVQAKLSLCEIRLSEDRCAAARCLEALRAREHDTLSTEIDRLFARWQLNQAGTCDHK